MRALPLAALLLSTLAPSALEAQSSRLPAAIVAAVASPTRPKADTEQDALRMPAQTLAFAGIKAGMAVGEFYPAGGYFTRMLSAAVGPKGHVYGIENPGWKGTMEADEKMIADGKLTNVSIVGKPFGTVDFPVPLDLVLVSQNYHDLHIDEYGKVDIAAFNKGVFAALKPGGVFVVIDHEAPRGTSHEQIAKLHRIERLQLIREVTAAGFRVADEAGFLRRPQDDHSLSIFDKAIRGHTDQYVLRFVKPPARH